MAEAIKLILSEELAAAKQALAELLGNLQVFLLLLPFFLFEFGEIKLSTKLVSQRFVTLVGVAAQCLS